MQNVTLRQLEAFLAVAEELHFGRAAERLSVSAPWMSHTVRDLERALRVELLSRTTRTVQVTPAGQVFAGLASQILTELSAAIKTVRSMSAAAAGDAEARLHDRAGLEVVPTLLRTYQAREPDAGIETEEFDFTDPSAGLRDNLVNAAVVRPPLGSGGPGIGRAGHRAAGRVPARRSSAGGPGVAERLRRAARADRRRAGVSWPVAGLLDTHRLPVRTGAGGRGG